jgi:hypothetical protein
LSLDIIPSALIKIANVVCDEDPNVQRCEMRWQLFLPLRVFFFKRRYPDHPNEVWRSRLSTNSTKISESQKVINQDSIFDLLTTTPPQ